MPPNERVRTHVSNSRQATTRDSRTKEKRVALSALLPDLTFDIGAERCATRRCATE